ncbi:MAG: DNA repair protein RadA, partial [Pseudolabrys sp.]
ARLKEAAKLGFNRAIVPEAARADTADSGLKVIDVATLAGLVADIAARGKTGMAGGKPIG